MGKNNKLGFSFDESVNGTINMTQQQKDDIMDFHEKRLMFAFIGEPMDGEPPLAYKINDKRDHCNWLHDEYGIDSNSFENLDRGYMLPIKENTIRAIVYKGINHGPTKVTQTMLERLKKVCRENYGKGFLQVYTGCKVGQIGQLWEPIEHVAAIRL